MFQREDWTLFRNIGTLGQKAGVPVKLLRRLLMKELVDNALDATGKPCHFGKEDDNTYWVEDDGPGLNMNGTEIANLFSISRPLRSSKLLRLPTRGALGNGLRVVVGIAMASGGKIIVETQKKYYRLFLNDKTGTSEIAHEGDSTVKGTKVTVKIGNAVPKDPQEMSWAELANEFVRAQEKYAGKTSAHWYDSDSFYELCLAAGHRPISHLVTEFDGITTKNVAKVLLGLDFANTPCCEINREQIDSLIYRLRTHTQPIKPKKIGKFNIGAEASGEINIMPGHGKVSAHIPFLVEAMAMPLNDDPSDDTSETNDAVVVMVNGSPITGEINARRQAGNRLAYFGCGLSHFVNASKRRCRVLLNVNTPFMPITTDGKEPDLSRYLHEIDKVVAKATKQFRARMKRESGGSGQREVIINNLEEAFALASGDGVYRFSLRQLFYAVRPFVLSGSENGELDYNYFARIITDYESERGEIPGMYRDPRGTLYHPHLNRSIPIGTIAVEEYVRPEWTFNKILYCEKEGFFSVLQQVRWPEEHDCALLSSKGFASRAVRDVLDLLGETDEEIQFFCIHDADASGTLIYQSLVEGTKARDARKVKIIDLGLNPWEAVDMGLQVENFTSKKGLPVARYVKEFDEEEALDGKFAWANWLQDKRVELNAMTSPVFLEWLNKKIKRYDRGKVIPPESILRKRFEQAAINQIRNTTMNEILVKNNFEQAVNERVQIKLPELQKVDLNPRVVRLLKENPTDRWDAPLNKIAGESI